MLIRIKNRLLRKITNPLRIYLDHSEDKEFLRWYFSYAKRLLKFRDLHKGEDCFIIGNGPSLNKMDLGPLKNHHTFGLNKIYLMSKKVDLDLSYLVSINPLVIEQSAREFEKLSCPTFLSYREAYNFVRPLDHIYFIFCRGAKYLFQCDLSMEMNQSYTVTTTAMQIAYYMGFKRIFLIGIDHNFSASGKPNEQQLYAGKDQNHFDPSYFENQQWHLPDLEGSELFYQIMNFFFSRNDRQIFDATVGGKLTIFPKISYEQALSMCSVKNNK